MDRDLVEIESYLGRAKAEVRVASRSILPRWGPIQFRPLVRAYAP